MATKLISAAGIGFKAFGFPVTTRSLEELALAETDRQRLRRGETVWLQPRPVVGRMWQLWQVKKRVVPSS